MEHPKTPRRGRPPLKPAERLVQRSVRLSAADWEKVDAAGGVEWLRGLVQGTKVATPAHAPRRTSTKRASRLATLFVID